jgi:hypothetical protein
MFSGTSEVDGCGDHQQYFTVVNKIFCPDCIGEVIKVSNGNLKI